MNYPAFFDQVEPIQLEDPLSGFLGAFEDGGIEITYLDCVKLAGHSCPTVAGAYLMAFMGLRALYGGARPQRGYITVEMRDAETNGVTGVTCTTISFVAGAGGDGGFKGIQGKMSRNNLVAYNAPIRREVRLTRLDTGASVEIDFDPSPIPPSPQMMPLMVKAIRDQASAEEELQFGRLWQERVERMLLSKDLWTHMVTVTSDSVERGGIE